MRNQMTLEETKALAKKGDYKVIPISKEIYSDMRTPIEVLRILQNVSSHCYILESIEDTQKWGRYTFLGYHPTLEITCLNGVVTIRNEKGVRESFDTKHPGTCLKQVLADYKSPKLENLPPFTGGLVGYFSYDYIKYSEPVLKLDAEDEEHFNDADLMLFDKVICFDHFRQKIIFIVNASTEDLENSYPKALENLEEMCHLVQTGIPKEPEPGRLKSEFRPLFQKQEFCDMVTKAKHHIKEGDIFQVVLSNRFEADFEGSLLDTYRVLRTLNPSPYMFYFSSDSLEIAGASPETLVKLEDGELHTFPLAGTRPRGKTAEEDLHLEQELLADEKERSEHNMLVDLGRNDIGKISRFDSVEVEKYMSIERYSHVMHIGSTVRGMIREDKTALDAGICIETVKELGSEIPILGVCLGHQSICEAYGATVSYAQKLMHGKMSRVQINTNSPVFRGMPEEIEAARYHSLAVLPETLPDSLEILGRAEDGEVMAVGHREYPVYGLQFHPESILTPMGNLILKNFFLVL